MFMHARRLPMGFNFINKNPLLFNKGQRGVLVFQAMEGLYRHGAMVKWVAMGLVLASEKREIIRALLYIVLVLKSKDAEHSINGTLCSCLTDAPDFCPWCGLMGQNVFVNGVQPFSHGQVRIFAHFIGDPR